MYRIGFDNDKYISMQSQHIKERINEFGGKLYLEFGGKLFDDFHASRVLPGFQPDSKIRMLCELKDEAEIIIAINSEDIEKNKVRGDLGITYDLDVLRLTDAFRSYGLYVSSVVLTRFNNQSNVIKYQERLESLGLKVYRHYTIPGYPSSISLIISPDGFGKNEYVKTERSLVVVTAPGPGSGKMAVCLSQLYNENARGVKAGYAKFETFPIWNIPLNHPVNFAYEAATADLNDVNMIDPWHLEAYGKTTVNYNRDVEVFPVLNSIFEKIYGHSPYKSPTDMGVNMAGNCITDDSACREASNQEIIRRYCTALSDNVKGKNTKAVIEKLELILGKAGLKRSDRQVIGEAMLKEELTNGPAAAIELPDGRIITGKTTDLLGACSSMLLNALKCLGDIDDSVKLLSPDAIKAIQMLKTGYLGNNNPRLHMDEILIALAICGNSDQNAKKAISVLSLLKGSEVHSSVILSPSDEHTFRTLGINITEEPRYQTEKLYHN